MREKDESNKLIDEKARVYEKEALELSKRASEAEAEVQRIKMSQIQAEETKIALERKVRETELMTHRLMQDRGTREPNQYYSQVQLNDMNGGSWYPVTYRDSKHHVSMMQVPNGEGYHINGFHPQHSKDEPPVPISYPNPMVSSNMGNYYPTTVAGASAMSTPNPTAATALSSASTTNLMQGKPGGRSRDSHHFIMERLGAA